MTASALDISRHRHESDDTFVFLLFCQTLVNDWGFRARFLWGLCLHGTALYSRSLLHGDTGHTGAIAAIGML